MTNMVDEMLKGESPFRRRTVPILRFFIAAIISLPVLPFLIVTTFLKDWVFGGETLTSVVGGLLRKSQAGLVQRAASRTAVLVAAARYIGFREGWTNDSLARHFIPYEVAKSIEFTRSFEIGYPVSLFYTGFLMARTVIGDRLILNRKPKQVVLLGAGLDTRAHRLKLPEGCKFYEIDIASTQGLKRRIAEAHPDEFKGPVTYVSVDFSRESFAEKLKQQAPDFDDQCTDTIILFEGVTMYLPWNALKSTMEMISANFAPGTIVGMDLLEDMFTTDEARKRQRRFRYARELVTSVDRLGEPFQWGIPEGESVESVFTPLGFHVIADLDANELKQRFLTPPGASMAAGRCPDFTHYAILEVQKNGK